MDVSRACSICGETQPGEYGPELIPAFTCYLCAEEELHALAQAEEEALREANRLEWERDQAAWEDAAEMARENR